MKSFVKKIVPLAIAAVAGGLLTFGISAALQWYPFLTDFHKAYQVYKWLNTHYLTPIPQGQLADGAIRGMLETLDDPYAEFLQGEEAAEFSESFLGEFSGIGADIQVKDGQIVVISPIDGSPAAAAGLRPNDIILEADGRRLDGMSLDDAARWIRGPQDTEISLLIRREGVGDFVLSMRRSPIPEQTVIVKELSDGLAVLRITEFSGTTTAEFEKALSELAEIDIKGLILDLRQNPGGMFSAAVDVASHFVPNGEPIVSIHFGDGTVERYLSDQTPADYPVVVLVDEGTASSAEIVAGALKDSAGAPLIGRQTFGKGIGQRVHLFPDGSTLQFTANEAATPSGLRFHNVGLTPDVEVALPDYVKLPVLHMTDEYKLGDSHPDIGLAQQYLAALGFDPGRTDGDYDAATKEAVANFQTSVNLNPSGMLDKNTSAVLAETLRNKGNDTDPQMSKAIDILQERIASGNFDEKR